MMVKKRHVGTLIRVCHNMLLFALLMMPKCPLVKSSLYLKVGFAPRKLLCTWMMLKYRDLNV